MFEKAVLSIEHRPSNIEFPEIHLRLAGIIGHIGDVQFTPVGRLP
jgi:hypothetical protein